MVKHNVHASVKDEKLVALRREQMIKGAVQLFKQKGFPRTTTREIAKAAGLVLEHFMNISVQKMMFCI